MVPRRRVVDRTPQGRRDDPGEIRSELGGEDRGKDRPLEEDVGRERALRADEPRRGWSALRCGRLPAGLAQGGRPGRQLPGEEVDEAVRGIVGCSLGDLGLERPGGRSDERGCGERLLEASRSGSGLGRPGRLRGVADGWQGTGILGQGRRSAGRLAPRRGGGERRVLRRGALGVERAPEGIEGRGTLGRRELLPHLLGDADPLGQARERVEVGGGVLHLRRRGRLRLRMPGGHREGDHPDDEEAEDCRRVENPGVDPRDGGQRGPGRIGNRRLRGGWRHRVVRGSHGLSAQRVVTRSIVVAVSRRPVRRTRRADSKSRSTMIQRESSLKR